MSVIEDFRKYEYNEKIIKIFLATQLIFVFLYTLAVINIESIKGQALTTTVMMVLPLLFFGEIERLIDNQTSIKRNEKELSINKLIKERVKISRLMKSIDCNKLKTLYMLCIVIIQVILVILTACFTGKIYEIHKNDVISTDSIIYPPILILVFTIIVQIVFIVGSMKNQKGWIKRIKDKDNLKFKIILEKDENVIETNKVNKINSLIKKGYNYNEDELRKALIE